MDYDSSPSMRRVWIEISFLSMFMIAASTSPSMRRVWIEMHRRLPQLCL